MPPPSVPASRWPKALLRTVIVLAILGGAGWGVRIVWKQISPGLFGNRRQDKIAIAKVRNAPIAEEIIAVGRLRAVFSTELRSEINGRIVKILVDVVVQMKKVDGKFRMTEIYYDPAGRHAA